MGISNTLSILIVLTLIFSGCSRNISTVEKNETAEKGSVEQKTPGNAEDNFGGKGDRIKKVEIVKADENSVSVIKNIINTDENIINRYFLISEISGKNSINPDDFEIGSLYSGETDFEIIAEMINEFFNELKNRKVKKELIDNNERFYLEKVFDDFVKNNHIPEKIRIGSPVVDGEIITVNLRLLKNSGKTEGEITIIKKMNSYYIKGFTGDLSLMDTDDKEAKGKFEPEIYKFN